MLALLLSSQYLWTRNKKSVFLVTSVAPHVFSWCLPGVLKIGRGLKHFWKVVTFAYSLFETAVFHHKCNFDVPFTDKKKTNRATTKKRTTVNPILPFCTGDVIAFSVLKNVILVLVPHNTTFHWRPLKTTFLFQVWNCCFKT